MRCSGRPPARGRRAPWRGSGAARRPRALRPAAPGERGGPAPSRAESTARRPPRPAAHRRPRRATPSPASSIAVTVAPCRTSAPAETAAPASASEICPYPAAGRGRRPGLPVAADQPPQQLSGRAGGDAPARLLPADPLGLEAPELPRVREVEALAERRAEAGAEHFRERVCARTAKRREHRIARGREREARRKAAQQVGRPEREREPAAREADPPVPGAQLQVVAEERAELAEDARVEGRVQPVAAVVDADPADLEAPRGPTRDRGPLEETTIARPERAAGMPRRRPPARRRERRSRRSLRRGGPLVGLGLRPGRRRAGAGARARARSAAGRARRRPADVAHVCAVVAAAAGERARARLRPPPASPSSSQVTLIRVL